MNDNFLGTGWAFPIQSDATGSDLAFASADDSIHQSIWIILSTAPGERVMRPDFGCDIHRLLFAPQDADTIGRAARAVRQALLRWEPRIDVEKVVVTPDPQQARLRISVDYRVRTSNSHFNLVYPFYLDRSVA